MGAQTPDIYVPPQIGPAAQRNALRLSRLTGTPASSFVNEAYALNPRATAGVEIGRTLQQILRRTQRDARQARAAEREARREQRRTNPPPQAAADRGGGTSRQPDEPPERADEAVQEAARRAAKAISRGRGRASTILTSPNIDFSSLNTARKTLLGGF